METGEHSAPDALPYVDEGYDDPAVRAAAAALVQEEMGRYHPPAAKYAAAVAEMPELQFAEGSFIPTELKRIAANKKLRKMDETKLGLPGPPKGKQNNVAAWEQAVANAQAQVQQSQTRLDNLELMAQYGQQAWQLHVKELFATEAALQRRVDDLRTDTEELNWQRKQEQTGAGVILRDLETQWGQLVTQNYEIELACQQMEQQLAALQQASS